MIKYVFSFIVLVFSILAMAEDNSQRPDPPSTEEVIKKATADLDLTEEQVTQWTKIHEKYESLERSRETMQKMNEELEATLTADQLKTFQSIRSKQRPRR